MKFYQTPQKQQGATLIELMVGLAIGLLVVAVAMGALLVSRGVSGTVSDASNIQQQAAYAMRLLGGQLRQAGSLYLNPDPTGTSAADPLSRAVFETDAKPIDSTNLSFSQDQTISGTATGFSTTFRRYKDAVFINSTPISLARNCLSGPADDSLDEAIQNIVSFDSSANKLSCGGNSSIAQPVIQNLAQFETRYLEQISVAGGSSIKYVTAADVTNWRSVQGVEVCLVLYGNESVELPAGTDSATVQSRSYTDCAGNSIDMAGLSGARKNRMHMTFRNTFQLRSQGLL